MQQNHASMTHSEAIKDNNPTLAGTIAKVMAEPGADHLDADDVQFLKFHGTYQQDDRDLRKTGKKYLMMTRGRIPGGVMTPAQWCVFDDLATRHGNDTLRITTRQSIQFHGIVLSGLRSLVKAINDALLSTLAACGDVNRNVLASPVPAHSAARGQVYADARRVAMALAPRTKAYHAIWIDGSQLDLEDPEHRDFVDPLYGKTYLPRKFKIAFVIPPLNDMDVFSNCMGLIAVTEGDRLLGYNLCLGGGMGRSHGNANTYPRLADVIGFFPAEKVVEVATAVLTIHRDFGDRGDRKHARLKYVIAERGVEWAREEVNRRAGIILEPNRPYRFTTTQDPLGWQRALDGSWFLGLFVSMGRVKGALKTALRQVAERFPGIEFRLTANQNVFLTGLDDADKAAVTALLESHGVKTEKQATVLHLASMACPSLPTCGLGLAEAERYLPGLIERIERIAADLGLADEEIVIRCTGCPNGCARPYTAELAFVGKAPGRYQIWLGGNLAGTRLNRLWLESVKDPEVEDVLRPLLARFATERGPEERFGDWADRAFPQETQAPTA